MKVQVLVSTMHQSDSSLIERMQIATDAVIVNQCDRDSEEDFLFHGHHITWINSTTRGLSKSRNICLDHASGDICLFADDDLNYIQGYETVVVDAFQKNPECSILRFKVKGIEKPFKQYPDQSKKIGFLDSLKMSSVEIAVLRESISGIRFDEQIGAGTDFFMGEENAFLAECLRKGLTIKYIPQTILELHVGNSSWYNGMNDRYFISRGAAFAAMKTKVTDLLILQFAIRKYKRYRKDVSFVEAFQLMKTGKKKYLRKQNREETK